MRLLLVAALVLMAGAAVAQTASKPSAATAATPAPAKAARGAGAGAHPGPDRRPREGARRRGQEGAGGVGAADAGPRPQAPGADEEHLQGLLIRAHGDAPGHDPRRGRGLPRARLSGDPSRRPQLHGRGGRPALGLRAPRLSRAPPAPGRHDLGPGHDGACRPDPLRRDPRQHRPDRPCRDDESRLQLPAQARAERPPLRMPPPQARQAACGRRGVDLRSDGEREIVCHATGTYSIPPR